MKKIIYIILCVLVSACSSLPKKAVINNPVKSEANQLFQKALSMEKSKNYISSKYYFELSMNKYALIDDREGVVKSKLGVAKQYLALNKSSEFNKIMADIYAETGLLKKKFLVNEYNMLKIQSYYKSAEYDSLAIVLNKMKDNEPEQLLRKYSWKCMLLNKQNKISHSHLKNTKELADKQFSLFKKNKFHSLSSLSFAYYAVGLSYYDLKEWDRSLESFNKAYDIDYLDQNYYNLATDNYFKGLIIMEKNDIRLANHLFSRSTEMFYQLNENNAYHKSKFKQFETQYLLTQDNALIQNMINLKNNVEDQNLKTTIENWLKDK